jgi:hypothetical protein
MHMLHTIVYNIYKYALPIGVIGYICTFLFYVVFPGPITFARSVPGFFSWFFVFLLGDWLNRRLGERSIFPHRKNQLHTLKRLALAGYIMNLISDATGAWLLKLWYYPHFDNPVLYMLVLAPLGYILFGLILYVFYALFKHHWDGRVKRGRLNNIQSKVFGIVIHLELLIGVVGGALSLRYYQQIIQANDIVWYMLHVDRIVDVNVWYFFLSWMSIFFLLEYACFALKRETLTRDIIHGNFWPVISIFLASAVCIVLVEFFNAPFQGWIFTNWPLQSIQFLGIPLVAYIVWPTQYLLLLPIIRLIDGKNEEHVW